MDFLRGYPNLTMAFSKKQPLSIRALLTIFALGIFLLTSCSSSGNDKESYSSGTTTGSGTAGPPAFVTVSASNNQISAFNGKTTVMIIVTDSSGRRTEAQVIMSSTLGGTFSNENGLAVGGVFITTYEATGGNIGNTEITATVLGTYLIKGSTLISLV
jgi:hypothetical protein